MEEKVICSSCGAQFPAGKVRCPYCGTAYEPAAEEEYMDKLEQVRTDLEGYKVNAAKTTGKALAKAVIVFAVVVLVVLILGIGIFLLPEMMRRQREQEKREEFLQKYSTEAQAYRDLYDI